ncbi:hypothetical protein OXPF_23960 [Oxobacter pfennigii]|uniref:Uncharacterized protein n=1 Tax=Oxobacter pfennigii TaxID=36849 RepID=A0A0P8X0E6_9CLOT|nr:hypothetical protein [Oxobacter pfennigii]KPU44228.1 hypothetical protein OXPF_23960 [Oxobacter pfennigii]
MKAKSPISEHELIQRDRELGKEPRKKDKLLSEEKEKVEILKKSLHIKGWK